MTFEFKVLNDILLMLDLWLKLSVKIYVHLHLNINPVAINLLN